VITRTSVGRAHQAMTRRPRRPRGAYEKPARIGVAMIRRSEIANRMNRHVLRFVRSLHRASLVAEAVSSRERVCALRMHVHTHV
jgi:hypothetical protein